VELELLDFLALEELTVQVGGTGLTDCQDVRQTLWIFYGISMGFSQKTGDLWGISMISPWNSSRFDGDLHGFTY